jgi:hypothetical protein
MSDNQEKNPLHPETFFLPPLSMYLAFCEKEDQDDKDTSVEAQEKPSEKDVEKLIEKLSEEKDE